ncbi:hypothetical protein SAMN04488128_103169 [Chitinophaga eiseniae]|uniref:Uncharacterized protein n=1 Tax=Chitinophaga eiseniae TaxID=634771 RepID=A0A1T4SNE9_9BACT|nr:hypothetical protein [Chitinophaga eiseniae]SKA29759.1 hypothetical protein SAMN04488128_103169 [Chitinophaga eiseniae]
MHGKIKITLGGQVVDLYFNNYSKAELGNLFGLDPIEAGIKIAEEIKANHMRACAKLIYSALIGYYSAKDMDCPYSRQQVIEWAAELSDADVVQVWECWKRSIEIPHILPPDANGDSKSAGKKKKHGTGS